MPLSAIKEKQRGLTQAIHALEHQALLDDYADDIPALIRLHSGAAKEASLWLKTSPYVKTLAMDSLCFNMACHLRLGTPLHLTDRVCQGCGKTFAPKDQIGHGMNCSANKGDRTRRHTSFAFAYLDYIGHNNAGATIEREPCVLKYFQQRPPRTARDAPFQPTQGPVPVVLPAPETNQQPEDERERTAPTADREGAAELDPLDALRRKIAAEEDTEATTKKMTEHRADACVLHPASNGVRDVLDFTIRHVSTTVVATANKGLKKALPNIRNRDRVMWDGFRGLPALIGEKEKLKHYVDNYYISDQYVIPIAVDTYGCFAPRALAHVAKMIPAHRRRYTLTRLSIKLQVANAGIVTKTRELFDDSPKKHTQPGLKPVPAAASAAAASKVPAIPPPSRQKANLIQGPGTLRMVYTRSQG
jgi:hypothetical protein